MGTAISVSNVSIFFFFFALDRLRLFSGIILIYLSLRLFSLYLKCVKMKSLKIRKLIMIAQHPKHILVTACSVLK